MEITLKEKEDRKKFQNQYKTIYHLRQKLITNVEKEDIRLVYLAVHHIIKYRGNFLYKMDKINSESLNIESKLKELFNTIRELSQDINIPEEYEKIINIKELSQKIIAPSRNDRKKYTQAFLKELFPENKLFINEFIKMINGNKFQPAKMFEIDTEEKLEITFNGNDYEDNYDKIEKQIGNKIEIIDIEKQLYDMIFLKLFLKDSKNISEAMIKKY